MLLARDNPAGLLTKLAPVASPAIVKIKSEIASPSQIVWFTTPVVVSSLSALTVIVPEIVPAVHPLPDVVIVYGYAV